MVKWPALQLCIRRVSYSTRDSVVSIATRHMMDGQGIEPWWGRDFPYPSHPLTQWVLGLFQGIKRPGRGADHTPQCSAEVKEKVELYPYFPSRPSWHVKGKTLPYSDPRLTVPISAFRRFARSIRTNSRTAFLKDILYNSKTTTRKRQRNGSSANFSQTNN